MSHGITNTDTLLSARNITPWHGLGVVLKRYPRSLDDALRRSGLGWTVRQEPSTAATAVRSTDFFNRDDGAGAVQLLTTPIRTVCRNTWDTAVASAVNTFSIRHVGSPSTRIAEARTALDLSIDYAKQFKRFGDHLAKQKIAERKVMQIATELWPDGGSDRQLRNAQARREAVLRLFSAGATVGNAPGTKWCAANALLEQLEWGTRARSPEGRFLRHISDVGGLKARALKLVLDA